jgi:translation initiation factor 2B subunit (eIF-2B alpha/beta/delta family)
VPDDATVCVIGWPDVVGEALLRRGDLRVLVVDAHREGSGFAARLVQAGVDCDDVPVEGMAQAIAACDVVILEAAAACSSEVLAVSGSYAAAVLARRLEVPVWLALGVGRLLPLDLYTALVERAGLDDEPWRQDDERVPSDLVDVVVNTSGVCEAATALHDVTCPVAPELLKDRRDID